VDEVGQLTGELWQLDAVEQRRLVAERAVSARELLDAHLARIEATNPAVNAVVALDPEVAAGRARAVDEAIAAGRAVGPLAGLVTAHKDLTETADFPTTYGSPVFAGFRPPADSLLVERVRAAGAVAVGKTNTPEFGAGSHTFNPVHGVTRNAWDTSRAAGGSSGGAAVALACGMVAVADGSDMGGSLRNPAAWNNVVGLRPTPGLLPYLGPRNPWLPLSTDGPMGRSVADVALLLSVLAAPEPRDPRQRPVVVPDRLDPPSRPLRVAWSRDVGGSPIETGQLAVLDTFRRTIDDLGWDVTDDEPDLHGADECFRTLRAWDFGTGPTGQLGDRLAKVKETVQDEVRRGRALSGQQIADAHLQLGALWRRAAAFFTRYDLLAAPVTQLAPFPVDWEYPTEIDGTALSTYTEWMAVCYRITVLGVPALSLPAGFDEHGLPVGVQLVAAHGRDVDLLRTAAALEAATGHDRRWPGGRP
jgi:amidase